MKAMVLREKGAPFSFEDVPDPTPGAGEAVARVLACGAGLTVHHARAGRVEADYPVIIGHEVAGEIVETGRGVESVKAGDIVTFHCYLTCGRCRWCRVNREPLCDDMAGFVGRHRDGGYAEYVTCPRGTTSACPKGWTTGRIRRRSPSSATPSSPPTRWCAARASRRWRPSPSSARAEAWGRTW